MSDDDRRVDPAAERAWKAWSYEHNDSWWYYEDSRIHGMLYQAFLAGYAAAEEQVCRRLIEEVDKIEGAKMHEAADRLDELNREEREGRVER